MTKSKVKAFLDILSQERQAVLQGDFDEMVVIGKLKENRFSTLALSNNASEEIEKIRAELTRNQSIISAAIAGVKSARYHLLDANKASETVNVYNKFGSLETFEALSQLNSQKY